MESLSTTRHEEEKWGVVKKVMIGKESGGKKRQEHEHVQQPKRKLGQQPDEPVEEH